MKRKPQPRKFPNIMITGTPGSGKSTICEMVKDGFHDHQLKHHDVSDIATQKDFVEERDEERETWILDEDKLCDFLEEEGLDRFGDKGGHLVEYHSCGFFAERYFDLVVVVRAKIEEVAKRLKKRQYKENKVRENVQCEIMQVCEDEARECYKKEIIRVVVNNTFEDLQINVKKIISFIEEYAKNH